MNVLKNETSHRLIGRERSAAQCVFLIITGDSYLAVYLIHFTHPISPNHTCQHYIGWAPHWPTRIMEHRAGGSDAARLCQVAKERGIDFVVARIWADGDRALERRLKNRHGAARFCPVCRGEMELLPDIDFYHAVGAKRHLAQEPAQKNRSVQTVCTG